MSDQIPASTRSGWVWPGSGFGRARLALSISLVLLTVGAWAATLFHTFSMGSPMGIVAPGQAGDGMAMDMPGMEMSGMAMDGMSGMQWSFAGLLVFLVAWTIMMAAMMLPAAAPMILIFASAQARRTQGVTTPTWIFVAGYLLVWAIVGLPVYAIVEACRDVATSLAPAERTLWAPIALGGILIAAGLYQFTPLKRVCLSHCRSPFAFVAQYWRDGRVGALGMGVRHGMFCLGCCWALFAVLVGAGVMSLAWMLLLTLVVFAEKVFPHERFVAMTTGVLLVALGSAVVGGVVPVSWLAVHQ